MLKVKQHYFYSVTCFLRSIGFGTVLHSATLREISVLPCL